MQYDVIVVGAGPAGSTAAREAAERGLSVVMLDRAEFPRDKPCGGGVNMRAAHLLPFRIDPVVEREIRGLRVSVKQGKSYVRYSDAPLTYMTQRRRLDAFLVERAVERGVVLHERAAVRSVERARDRVEVRTAKEHYHGRALVVADGANGRTASLAGIESQRDLAIAFEGNVSVDQTYPSEWRDVFGVEVGTCPRGYGWLFPKGDHVNIGIGGQWSMGPTLRKRLDSLTQYYGFDPSALWGVRGHPLPVRRPRSPVQDGNVVVVGDAAGLVDVLTGEGIFSAVWSGQAAARHLSAYLSGEVRDLSGYQQELEAGLGFDLRVSAQLHAIFHLSPPLAAELVRRSSRMWHLTCGLLTGNITYASLKRRSLLLTGSINAASSLSRLVIGRGADAPREGLALG